MYVSCPKCGQQNYSTATQCAYCGSGLAATGAGQGLPQGFAQTNAPGFASGATTGGGHGDPSSGGTSSQPQVGQLIDRKYRVERILGEGYRYLMSAPGRTYTGLDKGRELAKR